MIELLYTFFQINEILVLFGYGLVFFVLGLATALQSRRHSRLDMARSLGWLAAFGIAHGMFEWGIIFIPIQATYLDQSAVSFLELAHVVLLALSFTFLFQFGVGILRRRSPQLSLVPLVLMVVWLLWLFFPALSRSPDLETWHRYGIIGARYLIAFPAGIISAIGLNYQAEQYLKPMATRSIYNTLRLAGISLLDYAFFAGLLVPAADFFPASWLNEERFLSWFGISVPVFRSFTGLVLAISVIRALEVFDLEVDRLIEVMELERNLALERERIGRELHDGTIQTIYTAGLLIESARQKLPDGEVVANRLDRSMQVLNEAILGLRAHISELRPASPDLTLARMIQAMAADLRLASLVELQLVLNVPEDSTFNGRRIPHVSAILGEALSNAARHSQARKVKVIASRTNGQFSLVVEDNGVGFKEVSEDRGYGLRNMRDRARLLGGSLLIDSQPGKGTRVTLVAPWEEEE